MTMAIAATVTPVRVGERKRLSAATRPSARKKRGSSRDKPLADQRTIGIAMTRTEAFQSVDPKLPQAIDLKCCSAASAAALISTMTSHQSVRPRGATCRRSERTPVRKTSRGSSP